MAEDHQTAPEDDSNDVEEAFTGLTRLAYAVLESDDMTSRLCRIILQAAIGGAIILVPLVALAFIVMVKAPVDWKYIFGGGSTILITCGAWVAGHRRSIKTKTKKKKISAVEKTTDPAEGEDTGSI